MDKYIQSYMQTHTVIYIQRHTYMCMYIHFYP